MSAQPPFQAVTGQGVPILSVYLTTRKQALWWADAQGARYGAAKIVQHTKTGPRTIWAAERRAA